MTPADEVKRNAADTSDPDRVYSVVNNQTAIAGIEEVSTSWRRCLSEHGVDPSSNESPRILTDYELKEFRGPVEELVAAARKRE
jgi:transcriptional regulator of acetoin/glycerol metabolism